MTLNSHAELNLPGLPDYLDKIIDRLASYQAKVEGSDERTRLLFPFGELQLDHEPTRLSIRADAVDRTGLARLTDLAATAIQLYGKQDEPRIVWGGDLTRENSLEPFRLLTVLSKHYVTPRLLRIRFAGANLARFDLFGAMHVRLLFPTSENPSPVWPVLGENGLPSWPSETQKPVARAFTIRRLDIGEGWLDVDFVMHAEPGVASSWAVEAVAGDQIGVLGPIGRPLATARRYVIGADETGIPAVGRLLESFTPDIEGVAFLEVEDEAEIQDLSAPGFRVEWLVRNRDGQMSLSDAVCAETERLREPDAFGWFAAESGIARSVRTYWRNEQGLSRSQTLVAGYWQHGRAGLMAG